MSMRVARIMTVQAKKAERKKQPSATDRTVSDLNVLRNMVSDGMRVTGYTVSGPHRVLSYIQLLKQAADLHIPLPQVDSEELRKVLRGSDDEIDVFLDNKCHDLLRQINAIEDSHDSYSSTGTIDMEL